MSSISVRFNSFLSLFDFQWTLVNLLIDLVGLDGLEPSTSRLSGVRSNHLSYRPFLLVVPRSFPSVILSRGCGGDDGVRTHDPLLAGQVLSQLSYTPITMGILFKDHFWSLRIEQQKLPYRATDLVIPTPTDSWKSIMVSIERRWSSRTFRYGYLVTT